MDWVLILGLAMTVVALAIAGRRVWFLFKLITGGQPAPDRIHGVTKRLGLAVRTELVEVLGQRKLLKWTVPGAAHFFVFWAFVILGSVYVEAYGVLLGPDDFAIPLIGHWPILGFAQDFIALMALLGILVFAIIRWQQSPDKLGRKSRFKGSHLGGAYLVLFMIFNVIWTMFLFRGAAAAAGNYDNDGAFFTNFIGSLLDGLSEDTLHVLEGVGLLLHIGVMLVFLIEVVHSKHLHIFLAPLNVLFKRQPVALGAAKPLTTGGKPVTLDDIDDLDEDAVLGIGRIEDFSWKGLLDFSTCTECGRCQSQCPAWNTEKPLSPKLLIMGLRDHAMAKGPYLLADEAGRESLPASVQAEAGRELVGATEGEPWHPTGGAVIDTDVLWSCVTCGACVQQCPVDIEHVDHIVDMRRYQVLVESSFPAELNGLFKGMENKGNPWNMSPTARMDWAKGLDFEVPVLGEDLESIDSVEWLFWVGCAGAYEDRAKKTTQAVAELLHLAGVTFGVLGNGETCTGDSARRAGNEFVFQGLAQQNIETFREHRVKKIVTTCAHCLNTLKNEYLQLGIELEVTHHTQLLNRLVREGKLTPIASGPGTAKRSITYHDPCYLGRHNQVYAPPRELLQVLPGAEYVEMERNSERSFCCGAGGARMWMEETIGTRINDNRTAEAVGTGADQIAVGCPFCRVMLSDGLTSAKAEGQARDEVEVLDVAQLLLASVKGEPATKARAAEPEAPPTSPSAPTPPAAAPVTPVPAASAGSLFDVPATEPPAPAAPAAPAAPSGGSLFDVPAPQPPAPAAPSGGSLFDVPAPEPPAPASPAPESPGPAIPATGSLFDLPAAPAAAPTTPAATTQAAEPPATAIPAEGSLFDIAAPAAPAVVEPVATGPASEEVTEAGPAGPPASGTTLGVTGTTHTPRTDVDIHSAGSLFDIEAPEGVAAAAPAAPVPTTEPEPPAEAAVATEPATAPEPEPEPEPEGVTEAPAAPAPEPGGEGGAANEPEPGPTTPPAAPAPGAGEAHTPRTDVDIHHTESLFDI